MKQKDHEFETSLYCVAYIVRPRSASPLSSLRLFSAHPAHPRFCRTSGPVKAPAPPVFPESLLEHIPSADLPTLRQHVCFGSQFCRRNWVAEILHTDVKGTEAKERGTDSRTLQYELVSVLVPPVTVTCLKGHRCIPRSYYCKLLKQVCLNPRVSALLSMCRGPRGGGDSRAESALIQAEMTSTPQWWFPKVAVTRKIVV